jgi:hypothetical protein
MRETLIAVMVLLAGVICGSLFKPSDEQTRPLAPEKPSGDASGEAAGHHH